MGRQGRLRSSVVGPLALSLLGGMWVLTLTALTTPAAAAPVTPTVSGNTHAIAEDSPDPDIVRVGSTFYAFTTGTTWGNQIGIQESTQADPRGGWTVVGSAFPQVNFTQPLAQWEVAGTTTSPGVFNFDGKWIMYYDANNIFTGQGCLSVATASSVTGPYTDNSTGPLVCQTSIGGDLDPQPFIDPATGTPYLIWKSNDGSSAAASQVWSQPIGSDGVSLTGSPTAIFTIHSADFGWQQTTDDPSMVLAGGSYYLFFTGGNFQSGNYPTGYVVCSGPSGGCDLNESTDPILNMQPGGSGGGMVFSDASGHWWLASQTWEPTNCTNYGTPGCEREMFVASISLPQIVPPSITTGSLPTAGAGTPYSATLAATSGTAPYTWSVVGTPALPSALTLNSATGAISGTAPAATGTTTVTFEVTDAVGETATKQLALTVRAGSVTTPSASPTSIIFGTSITYSVTVKPATTGVTPTGSVTFSVGATTVCTATLASGSGSCSTATTPVGADTVTATYGGDATYGTSFGTTSVVVTSGPYQPVTPVRICDTRIVSPISASNQCTGQRITQDGTMNISAVVPSGAPSTATALVLNVTVVNPAAAGFVTIYPKGSSLPLASNVNYVGGEVVPNLVEVGTGASDEVTIFSSAPTDVVVDLEGYTTTTALNVAGLYNPLPAPVRICDTRPIGTLSPSNQCNQPGGTGGSLAAGQSVDVQVTGSNTIPNGATAAVFNVTVANPSGAGFLTVYPEDSPQPNTSNVNYLAGQVVANRVVVPLSTTGPNPTLGQIKIFSSQSADVIVDVSGYYTAGGGTGTQFSAEPAPVRICDTRFILPLNQCTQETIHSGGTVTVAVKGMAGVPATATAVVVNLTAVTPTAPTFLTIYAGPTMPGSSDLNPAPGEVRANMAVATINPMTGKITIFNEAGNTDVIVDVLGWYS
jgi:hypothetical protein